MSSPHPPQPPPKSPRMDHTPVLPNIHSNLEDKHKHHHERDRQLHRVDDNNNQGSSGQAVPRAPAHTQTHSHGHPQVGPVHHPLGRTLAREGYPPTHQYPDQMRRNGEGDGIGPSLPPPIKTTNHHGDQHQTASTPRPRFNIQPPSPPTDSYHDPALPLRPSHLNHKTIQPHTVEREMGLVELERQDNRSTREAVARAEAKAEAGGIASGQEIGGISRVGSGSMGIGIGGIEGGVIHGSSHENGNGQGNGKGQGQGMMGRFKTTFLSKNRGPMSKTWAKKSYLDDLESIGPSSPTSPTRSNWVGPGTRSAPVSPADLEGQRRPG